MNGVVVYTMRLCPFCKMAKELLASKGVEFQEVVVADDDDTQWTLLEKKSGMKTMPQIFQGETLIGGYNDLVELERKDGLASLQAKG